MLQEQSRKISDKVQIGWKKLKNMKQYFFYCFLCLVIFPKKVLKNMSWEMVVVCDEFKGY